MIELADSPRIAAADDAAKMVSLSQNEIESLCLKAARGAGFSWGLAEEAGFAAGWLAAHGIDGTACFLALLMDRLEKSPASGTPRPLPGHWQSTDQLALCPITLGASLSDSALLADGPFRGVTRIDPVAEPILLLAFLARAAQLCAKPVAINWQDGHLVIAENGAFDLLTARSWIGKKDLAMTIQLKTHPDDLQSGPTHLLPPLSIASLNGLNELAFRTTVPATDASRRDAGSATTDND